MAWPPRVADLRQEVTTQRSDASLHRILQAAVDRVASYGLSDAVSAQMALQLAVVDVQFDATRMTTANGGGSVIREHTKARNSVLIECSRLRLRKEREGDATQVYVPEPPETTASTSPVLYLSYGEWETRTQNTSLPVTQAGLANRSRVEALLADATAWCAATIPGNLMPMGHLIVPDELPAALVAVLKQVCFMLVDQWLAPRREKYVEDCAACEARAAQRLKDAAQAAVAGSAIPEVPEDALTPSDPVTPTVQHYRYFGWTDTDAVAAAALAASADVARAQSDVSALPSSSSSRKAFFAIPEDEGWPMQWLIGDHALFATPYDQQSGTLEDSEGVAHIVGVSAFPVSSLLGGQRTELKF